MQHKWSYGSCENLQVNMTLCLMKMHKNAPYSFQYPLHMASEAGDLALVENILHFQDEDNLSQDKN